MPSSRSRALGRTRASRALGTGLKTILHGFVFVATLEACARLDDYLSYGAPLLRNSSLADLQIVDALGIRGRPMARFQKWRLNRLGLQGPDVGLQKQPGHLRILVLGASESFGSSESPEMSFPAQLQRILETRAQCPIEVLSAALPGMTLPRATHFCASTLGRLQPDLVVYYPTPAAYLADFPPSETFEPPEAIGGKPRPELRFLPRLQSGLDRSLPRWVQDWRFDAGMRRALRRETAGKPEAWFFRDVPPERVRLFDAHLRALIGCVRRSRARLLLATHANRFREPLTASEERFLSSWRSYYPRAEPAALLGMERAANDRIRSVGESEDVPVVEIAKVVSPDPRNFYDFAHFTDRGAGLAAAGFAEAILHPQTTGSSYNLGVPRESGSPCADDHSCCR